MLSGALVVAVGWKEQFVAGQAESECVVPVAAVSEPDVQTELQLEPICPFEDSTGFGFLLWARQNRFDCDSGRDCPGPALELAEQWDQVAAPAAGWAAHYSAPSLEPAWQRWRTWELLLGRLGFHLDAQ